MSEKKYFIGWTNIKWLAKELIYTFSNKPSFFSRKRIESCVLFINAMVLLDVWYVKNIQIPDKIQLTEALAVFTAQMVYAGYQITQIRKDNQATAAQEPKQDGV